MRMPRLTAYRLTVAAGVACSCCFGACRANSGDAAPDHGLASERYAEYARAYESAADGKDVILTTCYGSHWNDHSRSVYEDIEASRGDKGLLREKAARFLGLSKSEAAASVAATSATRAGSGRER